MRRLLGLALAISAVVATPACAQDVWSWSVLVPSYAQTDILSTMLREDINRRDTTPAPPRAAAPVRLRYTPSPARRSANLARFVAKTRKVNPGGADDLERLFATDLFGQIGGLLRPYGLRTDDVADAYTVWWIAAWDASRGHGGADSDHDRATYQAVRAQAARALARVPSFAGADDAARQEFAELLLVQAVLAEAAVTQAKGDPQRLRAVAGAVNQGARAMGVDLTAMALTPGGFVAG
ncbi:DUF6683 family protein [Sphingomonas sp. MMS12-HWE2-04]|uniref:DUF6683 family protein n=1 Tax=Sphingomonas sp. MMS12-HWE2-04 TaxID=3234199 RepID=UPI00384AA90B